MRNASNQLVYDGSNCSEVGYSKLFQPTHHDHAVRHVRGRHVHHPALPLALPGRRRRRRRVRAHGGGRAIVEQHPHAVLWLRGQQPAQRVRAPGPVRQPLLGGGGRGSQGLWAAGLAAGLLPVRVPQGLDCRRHGVARCPGGGGHVQRVGCRGTGRAQCVSVCVHLCARRCVYVCVYVCAHVRMYHYNQTSFVVAPCEQSSPLSTPLVSKHAWKGNTWAVQPSERTTLATQTSQGRERVPAPLQHLCCVC